MGVLQGHPAGRVGEDTRFSSESSGKILRTSSRESCDTVCIMKGTGSLCIRKLFFAGNGAEKSEERFGLLVFGDRGKVFLML